MKYSIHFYEDWYVKFLFNREGCEPDYPMSAGSCPETDGRIGYKVKGQITRVPMPDEINKKWRILTSQFRESGFNVESFPVDVIERQSPTYWVHSNRLWKSEHRCIMPQFRFLELMCDFNLNSDLADLDVIVYESKWIHERSIEKLVPESWTKIVKKISQVSAILETIEIT